MKGKNNHSLERRSGILQKETEDFQAACVGCRVSTKPSAGQSEIEISCSQPFYPTNWTFESFVVAEQHYQRPDYLCTSFTNYELVTGYG